MRVLIIYAHPSGDSFTSKIRDSFIRGLESAGHSFILSDLYKMNFRTDMSEGEYLREAYYRGDLPVPADVAAEQEKINASDAIVFISPLFWSDVPAKLKGWFDRVWTYGFAYSREAGPGQDKPGRTMRRLEKGLYILSAGNTMEYFNRTGLLGAIKKVLLEDRLYDRVKSKDLLILDGTSREMPSREQSWDAHLEKAFRAGAGIAG
ncbi:MAG: NAD(P)H-dependent oxidoreductase [Treponema sp.]|jgi:NAD(P)H dehydrogenase (quinone)|nr:NAD(P)H-dependent oxidoreductase [Treponema sp.]